MASWDTDLLARHGATQRYERAGPLTVHITKVGHVPNRRYRVVSGTMAQGIAPRQVGTAKTSSSWRKMADKLPSHGQGARP